MNKIFLVTWISKTRASGSSLVEAESKEEAEKKAIMGKDYDFQVLKSSAGWEIMNIHEGKEDSDMFKIRLKCPKAKMLSQGDIIVCGYGGDQCEFIGKDPITQCSKVKEK